jgi:hypothetical protein
VASWQVYLPTGGEAGVEISGVKILPEAHHG